MLRNFSSLNLEQIVGMTKMILTKQSHQLYTLGLIHNSFSDTNNTFQVVQTLILVETT